VAAVRGRPGRLDQVLEISSSLGVTDEEIRLGTQPFGETTIDALLRGSIEVDDHVTTEDSIEWTANGPGLRDEIQLTECDQLSNL
jgi:hypothetical protein